MNHSAVNPAHFSRSIPLKAMLAFAVVELAMVICLLMGEQIYFVGACGLFLLGLAVINNIKYGLYALPVALATPVVLIPQPRIHMGEVVIFLILCSLFCMVAWYGEMRGISFPRKYISPLILLVGANLASLLNAEYPGVGLMRSAKLILAFVVIFGITYHYAKSQRMLKNLSLAISIGGLVAALYGITQYFMRVTIFQSGQGERIFGAIGGSYGLFVGVAIASSFSAFLFDRNLKRKALFLLLLVPMTYALLASGTRAWILATILAVLVIFVLGVCRRKTVKRLITMGVVLILVVLLLLGVAQNLLIKTFTTLFVRTPYLPTNLVLKSIMKLPDPTLSARYKIWDFAWKEFLRHPLTGVGVGNMRIAGTVNLRRVKPGPGMVYTDNHYVNVLAETGILGGLAWIYLLGILFSSTRKAFNLSKDHQWKSLTLGFLGGVIVFLVGGVFWLLTAYVYDSAMLAFLFALLFSSERVLKEGFPRRESTKECIPL
jgi:O-antigen ligase